MAYNPFNIFRRNQKVIFAILTVFIMIMFTLSSGVMKGDFFEWFTQWLGSRGKRGDAICTIDGTKIFQRDITALQRNRRMANHYMYRVAFYTAGQFERAVRDQVPNLSPAAREPMMRVLQSEQMIPLYIQSGMGERVPETKEEMRLLLLGIIDSPTATTGDKDIARTKLYELMLVESMQQRDHYFNFAPNRTTRDAIDFMLWQKKADELGIQFTTEDVKKLARMEMYERLTAEVESTVQKELISEMQGYTNSALLKALGEEFRVRTAQIAVLGPEIHGGRGDKTAGGFAMFNPPYEAFEFYREYCSPTSYAVIPVPAANLVAEVERRMKLPPGNPERIAEPTENELRNLFGKYRDVMASPARESPGFKIPERIRVDFFKVTGEEPYYKAEAKRALQNEVLETNLWSAMSAQVFGPPAPLVAIDARAFVTEPLLSRDYSEIVRKHNEDQAQRYGSSEVNSQSGFLGKPIMESSVVRPVNLAVAVGAMGGQLAAFGNLRAGLAVTMGGPMAFEIRDRIRVGMPAVLGMVPLPGMFNTAMGGAAAYEMMLPKPLPIEAYRANFIEKLTDEKAKEIAFTDNGKRKGELSRGVGDITEFTEEVSKLSENGLARDMGPAQRYIEDFLATRRFEPVLHAAGGGPAQAIMPEFVKGKGFAVHGNKTPRTEWNLEESQALAPLVEAQKESLLDPASPHRSNYTPFGHSFFWNEPTFMARTATPAKGRYVPREYPPGNRREPNKPKFVVWRTEEIDATPVNWNDATRAVVLDTWKHLKARELAKEKAEAVATGIRAHVQAIEAGGKGPVNDISLIPFLLDESAKLRAAAPDTMKAQRRAMPFPIRGVSPLTSLRENPAAGTGLDQLYYESELTALPSPYMPFQFLPSENIKYPSAELGNSIVRDRTKPPGTVLVLPDAPKDIYFVVTLVKRHEKTDSEYNAEVGTAGPLSQAYGGRNILAEFQRTSMAYSFQSVKALLKQEFKYEETDEQKKKLDENEQRGGAEM